MKPRIEKKLSKRLAEIAPSLFGDAWVDRDKMESSWDQGVGVSHCLCVGGGVDYWGEGQDAYTVWAAWTGHSYWAWEWHGDFPDYPEGHEFHGYPDTRSFKATTHNLLRLAAGYERAKASHAEGGKV